MRSLLTVVCLDLKMLDQKMFPTHRTIREKGGGCDHAFLLVLFPASRWDGIVLLLVFICYPYFHFILETKINKVNGDYINSSDDTAFRLYV